MLLNDGLFSAEFDGREARGVDDAGCGGWGPAADISTGSLDKSMPEDNVGAYKTYSRSQLMLRLV